MGVESNARQNLENLSQSILEFSMDAPTETAFLSFQAALEHVFRLAKEKRLILAIDEYPYGIATGASYFVLSICKKRIHQGLHRFGEKIRKRGTGNLS